MEAYLYVATLCVICIILPVNITQLPCDFSTTFASSSSETVPSDDGLLGSGVIDPDNTAVCGSNGISYPAICHIIPNYPRVFVIHAGRCDDFDCRGGSVSVLHDYR